MIQSKTEVLAEVSIIQYQYVSFAVPAIASFMTPFVPPHLIMKNHPLGTHSLVYQTNSTFVVSRIDPKLVEVVALIS